MTQNKPEEITWTVKAHETKLKVYWIPEMQTLAIRLKGGLWPLKDEQLARLALIEIKDELENE